MDFMSSWTRCYERGLDTLSRAGYSTFAYRLQESIISICQRFLISVPRLAPVTPLHILITAGIHGPDSEGRLGASVWCSRKGKGSSRRSASEDCHRPRAKYDCCYQLRLAPLSRLVMCSDGVPGMDSSPMSKGHERLGGRSPLSLSIAISVAQPGVLESCIPSARS